MSIQGTKYGDALLLQYMTGAVAAADFKLHLFSNNHAPGYDDAIGAFTELVVAGYAALTLLKANWSFTTADPFAFMSQPAQNFTFTAACTAYGYYISDNGNTVVLAAELFSPAAFSYGATGGPLVITPLIGLQ